MSVIPDWTIADIVPDKTLTTVDTAKILPSRSWYSIRTSAAYLVAVEPFQPRKSPKIIDVPTDYTQFTVIRRAH
jgi:hypothetical protein